MAARARLAVVVLASALVAGAALDAGAHDAAALSFLDAGERDGARHVASFRFASSLEGSTRRDALSFAKDGGTDDAPSSSPPSPRDPEKPEKHAKKKRVHKKKCAPMKHPAEERCAYVESHPACERDDNLVHYLRLHFCAFGPKRVALSRFTQGAALALLCAVLATVAERFFCPALANIARWLELSDDVAGTTLLSFGNGSPDVFAQIAALSDARAEGVSLGVGAALGSTFFVASAVLPLVVLCAKDAKEGVRVDAASFVRDGAFYLAAVVSVAGMLAGGSVSAAQATSAFFLYPVYLGAVLLPGRVRLLLRRLKSGLPGPTSPRADAADDDARTNAGSASRTFSFDGYSTPPEEPPTSAAPAGHREPLLAGEVDPDNGSDWFGDAVHPLLDATDSEAGELEKGRARFARLASILARATRAPLLFVLRFTMPEVGKPLASRGRWATAALPVTAPLFFASVARFLNAGSVTRRGVMFGMACGSIGSVALFLSWPALVGATREHPRVAKRLDFFFTLVAFVQAVMWMDAAAGELVALFGAIGRISGVSESLLGATVFAWGISVSDLVSDTTVARRGMARAALAACFGGPLFNLLVGLCGSLVFATANHGTIRGIRVDNEIIVLMVCQVCAAAYLIAAVPILHGGKITRVVATGMLAFYVTAQILVALVAGSVIFPEPWM